MNRLIAACLFSAVVGYGLLAWGQMNFFDPMMGGEPSCARGNEWLKEHNFTVCRRTRVIEESCIVETMACTIIPRPV